MGIRTREMRPLVLVVVACAACCVLAQHSQHPDTCKSRDGGNWVKPRDCEHGCCIHSADQGRICGSIDDCSHATGAWWLMILISMIVGLLAVFGCLLLLACFDVPLPCCDKQIRGVLQSWTNRQALRARSRDSHPDTIS